MAALLSALLVLSGVTLYVLAHQRWLTFQEQLKWERVEARVTWTGLNIETSWPKPEIRYEYQFRGDHFVGDAICSGMRQFNWPWDARRYLRRYPVGTVIAAYVNPADPLPCVLKPGGDSAFLPKFAGMAAVLVVCGIVVAVV